MVVWTQVLIVKTGKGYVFQIYFGGKLTELSDLLDIVGGWMEKKENVPA